MEPLEDRAMRRQAQILDRDVRRAQTAREQHEPLGGPRADDDRARVRDHSAYPPPGAGARRARGATRALHARRGIRAAPRARRRGPRASRAATPGAGTTSGRDTREEVEARARRRRARRRPRRGGRGRFGHAARVPAPLREADSPRRAAARRHRRRAGARRRGRSPARVSRAVASPRARARCAPPHAALAQAARAADGGRRGAARRGAPTPARYPAVHPMWYPIMSSDWHFTGLHREHIVVPVSAHGRPLARPALAEVDPGLITVGVAAFGAVELALAVWMVVAPRSFYTSIPARLRATSATTSATWPFPRLPSASAC